MAETKDIPIWELTPDEITESYDIDLAELRRRALRAYLPGDPLRTQRRFQDLWAKWLRGGSRMPVSVQMVLEPIDGADERTYDLYRRYGRTPEERPR